MGEARTASTSLFMQYAPSAAGSEQIPVPVTFGGSAQAGGPFSALPPPVPSGGAQAIDLSNPVPLRQAALFHAGEPLFIVVSDGDQNTDPLSPQTIIVAVVSNGDTEVLLLTETGPDTGIFAGYIQSVKGGVSVPGDGFLFVTVANFRGEKDHENLLAAIRSAGDRLGRARFVLVGRGSLQAQVAWLYARGNPSLRLSQSQ